MKTIQFILLVTVMFFASAAVFAQPDPAQAGEALMKKKKYTEAIAAFDAAIKAEPKLYKHYYNRGLCEVKVKKNAEAKADFEKAANLNKKYAPPYLQLGNMAKTDKKYDEAVKYFDQAIVVEADQGKKASYTMMIVDALLKKGDLNMAEKRIEPLQKVAPNNLKVIYYAAEIKANKQDWKGCVAEYQRATTLDAFKKLKPEQQAQYHYAIGMAYIKMKDMKNARASWQKAYVGHYKDKIAQEQPEWAVAYADRLIELKDNPNAGNAGNADNNSGTAANSEMPEGWGNTTTGGGTTTNTTTTTTTTPDDSGWDTGGGSSGGGDNIDWGF
ncbi:MAG: tetratricopeptide repeat protein [Bacteroidia bacterium]